MDKKNISFLHSKVECYYTRRTAYNSVI